VPCAVSLGPLAMSFAWTPRCVASVKLPAAIVDAFFPAKSQQGEPVSVPLGLAFLIGILWLASDSLLRKGLSARFGSTLDEDGVPRYRCASGFSTQLVFLPCLFLLSFASNNFSLDTWSQRAGAAHFTEEGTRFFDWAFCYVFAGYMLSDVVLLKKLSFLLKLHHVGCLLGLALGFAGLPAGFPLFAAGVLSLELGSAAMNLWCLYPHRSAFFRVYAVVMTLSNTFSAVCCAMWIGHAEYLATQLGGVGLSCLFILIRQKTVFDAMAKRAAEAAGTASPKASKKPDPVETARCESPKSAMSLLGNFSMRLSPRRKAQAASS
jgi:hypothetical protein